MPESEEFQVVVSGNVVGDRSIEEVASAFARLLKIDANKAQKFLQGNPRVIKKRADAATATKFEQALTGIGVETSVMPLGSDRHGEGPAEPAPASGMGLALEPTEGAESAPDGAAARESSLALSLEPAEGTESSADGAPAHGSSMICPGCKTLQPRAEQCPACGIYVEKAKKLQHLRQ